MNRIVLPRIVLVVVQAGLASAAFCELTPDQSKQAEAFIAQFSAKEFAARQAAVEKLIALGPDVVPLIRKTLAETKDAEVKMRCEMVLKGLHAAIGQGLAEKSTPGNGAGPGLTEEQRLNGEGSLVSLDVRDALFAEVMETLAQETGNLAFLPHEEIEARITLKADKRPYWEVLDRLCELAGVRYDVNYGTHAARFVAQRSPLPRTYAGPVNVRVLPPDPQSVPPEKSVLLRLEYLWEDRMPVGGAQLSVEKVVFADGAIAENVVRDDYWGGFFASANSTEITLHYGGRRPERIAELQGTLRLYLASGEATWTVPNVLTRDETDKIVDRFVAGPRVDNVHRTELSLWMTVSLRSEDNKPEAMNPLRDARYRFFLIDPEGKRFPSKGQYVGESGVTEKLTGLVFVVGGVDDKCICARTVGFPVLPPDEKGWTLECTLPKKTILREYRFTLRDIPIPPQPEPKKEVNP